jgi:hypothetical protein
MGTLSPLDFILPVVTVIIANSPFQLQLEYRQIHYLLNLFSKSAPSFRRFSNIRNVFGALVSRRLLLLICPVLVIRAELLSATAFHQYLMTTAQSID